MEVRVDNDKEVVRQAPLKITHFASKVVDAAWKAFYHILASVIPNGIKQVVKLLTPNFRLDQITGVMGQALGTAVCFQYRAEVAKATLYKVTAVGCQVLSENSLKTAIAKAGVHTICASYVQLGFVVLGGVAGGIAILYINGVVQKLFFNKPEDKKIIDEAQAAAERAEAAARSGPQQGGSTDHVETESF